MLYIVTTSYVDGITIAMYFVLASIFNLLDTKFSTQKYVQTLFCSTVVINSQLCTSYNEGSYT